MTDGLNKGANQIECYHCAIYKKKDLDMRELKENHCSFTYDFFTSVAFSGQKEHQTHQTDVNTKKLIS